MLKGQIVEVIKVVEKDCLPTTVATFEILHPIIEDELKTIIVCLWAEFMLDLGETEFETYAVKRRPDLFKVSQRLVHQIEVQ
jgi:hypothetical protein